MLTLNHVSSRYRIQKAAIYWYRVLYRAHTSIDDFNIDLSQVLQKLSEQNKDCYMLGDYNIDLLKDEIHRPTGEYLDLIYSHHIIPTILKPTRITDSSATIIDNILTNCHENIRTRIILTDITDHLPTIYFKNLKGLNQTQNSRSRYVYKRNHSENDIDRFRRSLSKVNWNEILDGDEVNSDYSKFLIKFNELYDECIPVKM